MNNMFFCEETNTAIRILIQIAKQKQADIDILLQLLYVPKTSIESVMQLLLEKNALRTTDKIQYKLSINPATTTLYDVAEIMEDPYILLLDKKCNLTDADELERFYDAAREINKNWMKSVTVADFAGNRLKRRGK